MTDFNRIKDYYRYFDEKNRLVNSCNFNKAWNYIHIRNTLLSQTVQIYWSTHRYNYPEE